jgi:hypothetical protein
VPDALPSTKMKRTGGAAYYSRYDLSGAWLAHETTFPSMIGSGIADLKKTGLWIVLFLALSASSLAYAHGNNEYRIHGDEAFQKAGERKSGVGEISGQISAWLLGIANFPVVFSILLKAGANAVPEGTNYGELAARINRKQKKYLMHLHYWLNPFAVGVAIIHFSVVEYRAAFIPELGLGAMLMVCILGLMVAFRLSPASIRKAVFKLHTSPIALVACISILLFGHSMMH